MAEDLEDYEETAVGYEFPTADWLDPFDVEEPATQRFFVNQDRLSRAWIAPAEDDRGWGFADDEPLWQTFNNPRSCLYCLEKLAVVSDGRVLREWSPSPLKQAPVPKSCEQHNGLYFLHGRGQRAFPIHEAIKYATYDEALAAALADGESGSQTMIARMVFAQSLW